MSTPGTRTIIECPECHSPCLRMDLNFGSLYVSEGDELSDNEMLSDAINFDDKNITKCPHCSKNFSTSEAEITCIYFISEGWGDYLETGAEINGFLDFLGIETYGKTFTNYRLYSNKDTKGYSDYNAYCIVFKELKEDYKDYIYRAESPNLIGVQKV